MKSFKAAPSDIVDWVLMIDEYQLSEDKLSGLIRMSPKDNEAQLLRDNAGISDELSESEQFLLMLLKVPNLNEHLECILFKISFQNRFLELNKGLKALKKAIVSIQDNYELE